MFKQSYCCSFLPHYLVPSSWRRQWVEVLNLELSNCIPSDFVLNFWQINNLFRWLWVIYKVELLAILQISEDFKVPSTVLPSTLEWVKVGPSACLAQVWPWTIDPLRPCDPLGFPMLPLLCPCIPLIPRRPSLEIQVFGIFTHCVWYSFVFTSLAVFSIIWFLNWFSTLTLKTPKERWCASLALPRHVCSLGQLPLKCS